MKQSLPYTYFKAKANQISSTKYNLQYAQQYKTDDKLLDSIQTPELYRYNQTFD